MYKTGYMFPLAYFCSVRLSLPNACNHNYIECKTNLERRFNRLAVLAFSTLVKRGGNCIKLNLNRVLFVRKNILKDILSGKIERPPTGRLGHDVCGDEIYICCRYYGRGETV